MDIVILDLEWNGTYSRRLKGYINEIIEFGAVKCGPDLSEKATFSCFVKPQVAKHISSTISTLTSITDETLTGGATFMQAVSRFKRWAGDCVVMTWGTSDILTLIENCRYFSGDEHVPFLSRYCDLQVFAQDRMGLGRREQVGLSKAAELLGLDVSGMEHHRALDDSRMTLEILRKIYDPGAIAPYIDLCDREFYRRITFKTTYICDIHSPLVEKSHLRFPCPRCGRESRRLTRWNVKNKSFRADFRCTCCGHLFAGRLTIKQKYEGLTVNTKTFPLPDIQAPRQAAPGPLGNMELTLPQGVGVLLINFSKLQFDISLVHENRPRDGLFDVVVMNSHDAFGLIPALISCMLDRGGEFPARPDVIDLYRGSHVTVVADPPLAVQYDGEVTGAFTPFTARMMPEGARFIVSEDCLKLYDEEPAEPLHLDD